ncbi:ABC transporter permease [Arthrobacter sp. VKM Ac-2550]|uniref:ABC transporter permease n=1 Tax=Crystallibacter permensis TaxID=1938888 RepID=UPI002227B6C2|nr:ABC transporter permease [Arthrobacter sp. VKM Ac-2550]MCW2132586.1 peptide/nickel transport system permease protein [Arthrobacter sp. VKM Ac-2550]
MSGSTPEQPAPGRPALSDDGRGPARTLADGVRLPTTVRWLLAKVVGAVFVLWAVATLIFFGIRLIPGDPAEAILGGPGSQASPEALEQVRRDYGLDQPLLVQYFTQLGRLVQGDLGDSYSLRMPVAELLGNQLPGTLLLSALALLVAWLLALGLAGWSTLNGKAAAVVASGLEIAAAAVPHFWLASILILLFSNTLGWLPPVSTNSADGLVLPVLALALPLAGFLGQVMRESMLNAMTSPFALSARARGEGETGVLFRHALRHAALPGIALSGWAFGSLLSGAVVVESIFARPGLGRTLLNAVTLRDIPLVTGVALVSALAYVVVMAASDVAERAADPRLRAA